MASVPKVVVIGAGVGGLTCAALLARAGFDVTVLEAHVYSGGCAGTFFHKGYHFDAGATLAAGFYRGGPMDMVAQAAGIAEWPAHPSDPAMSVHLPDGQAIVRWGDATQRWATYRDAFGAAGERFWRWQESTADALWALALQSPPWPPQELAELLRLGQIGLRWLWEDTRRLHPTLLQDAFRPIAHHLQHASHHLRLFIDGQLLIAAQTTSRRANALYGASALDLPRRGVVHLTGGMGAIADTLAQAVQQHGGRVLMRRQVTRIICENGRPVAVETKRQERYPADIVIANLPPWNIRELMGENSPSSLHHLSAHPQDGWGAFMVYAGIDDELVPPDLPLHHQVLVREPLGEGNSLFLSISPAWDRGRAPAGQRALTISTHTGMTPWWRLFERDRRHYEQRKQVYTERLLAATEQVLPGLQNRTTLVMPGTPVTFQRFTRRKWGWVGGFPQTDLLRAWAPRLGHNLWMVGDSIFPGQSTAAVVLGGLRVAYAIMRQTGTALATSQKDRAWPVESTSRT